MNGTSQLATAEMRLMPPRITAPVSTASTMPVTDGATPNDVCIAAAMLFDCTMLPMPKPATPPNTAKAVPSHAQRLPRPFLIAYIGPPTKRPCASRSRKCTASTTSAYLVAMPTSAVIHIQNTAPGPPSAIAVATPAMFPTPIVAARQVISAANGLTSPG